MERKRAFVLGMARSGFEASKLLISKGYEVTINDANIEQNREQVEESKALGVNIVLGSHPEDLFDSTYEMLIKNPGISNEHKYVEKANKLSIPVINELELAFRYFPTGITIIGVTGTNGKTTTTTMIYEFLRKASKRVFLMGNIGYPACSFIAKLKENDIAVIEVSDHQLCNVINFKTNISVLTNISEAHLDFHGSYDNYKSMKKRIFNHHTKDDVAILNLDDKEVLNLSNDIESVKRYFSSSQVNQRGCSIIEGYICYSNHKIIALDDIRIKGIHNYENAMAAIEVVKELGIEDSFIIEVLKTFSGVEHRIEYVKTINNIDFYNDSKSTNVKSTQIALTSITKPTILLLGGLDRGNSFDELNDYLKHVKLIVTYGEAKIRINDFAIKYGVPCKSADTLEEATNLSYVSAIDGDVILLSPACASWDQFKDFEIRGNMFKEYINKLEN